MNFKKMFFPHKIWASTWSTFKWRNSAPKFELTVSLKSFPFFHQWKCSWLSSFAYFSQTVQILSIGFSRRCKSSNFRSFLPPLLNAFCARGQNCTQLPSLLLEEKNKIWHHFDCDSHYCNGRLSDRPLYKYQNIRSRVIQSGENSEMGYS